MFMEITSPPSEPYHFFDGKMLQQVKNFPLRSYISVRKLRHVVITLLFFFVLHVFVSYENSHDVQKRDFAEERMFFRKLDANDRNEEHLSGPFFTRQSLFNGTSSSSVLINPPISNSNFSSTLPRYLWHNSDAKVETAHEAASEVAEGTDRYGNALGAVDKVFTDYDKFRHERILEKLVPFHKSSDSNTSLHGKTKPLSRSWNTSPSLQKRTTSSSSQYSSSKFTQKAKASSDYRPKWTRISEELFIYSSFWDDRSELNRKPFSRTLGILKYDENLAIKKNNFKLTGELKPGAVNVSCYLWHTNSNKPVLGELEVSFFEEGLNKYIGVFLTCNPYSRIQKNPTTYSSPTQIAASSGNNFESDSNHESRKHFEYYAVSFVPDGSPNYPHKLSYFENPKPEASEFEDKQDQAAAVCVRPLYGPYNDTAALLQFIVYYHAVLHIKTFYFYDLSMTYSTRKLIESLQSSGVNIEVLTWNLPTGGWTELWDYGSLTASNDCVYRAMSEHKYAVMVDIDEFIVPKDKSIKGVGDVYNSILVQKSGKRGDAALVPNAFFCEEFKGNANPKGKFLTNSPKNIPKIFRHTVREGRAWPATIRSKMIITPVTVVSVGHHMVHHFVKEKIYNNLGGSIYQAVLNHYRACAGLRHGLGETGAPVVGQAVQKDFTMMQFKGTFIKSELYKSFQHLLQE